VRVPEAAFGVRELVLPYEPAHVFTNRDAGETFHWIVQDIELGSVKSVPLPLPQGPAWPLRLHELALTVAERASSMNVESQLMFVIPEVRPVTGFGGEAGEAVARPLGEAGVVLHTGATARVTALRVLIVAGSGSRRSGS
jgi:hypothetical protein